MLGRSESEVMRVWISDGSGVVVGWKDGLTLERSVVEVDIVSK